MIRKDRKIAVLGTGNVGATIAYALTLQGVCSELILVDVNKTKAEGEALDLSHCGACVPSVKIRSGEYADVAGADIVIVTFGIARKADQSRLDLAKVNVGIIKSVMPEVVKYAPEAIYIIVSNPVDVLTYATMKCTGLPRERVIGTGTLLDSNRLIHLLSRYCDADPANINAFVLGEHGDSCIIPWSICSVSGVSFDHYYQDIMKADMEALPAEKDKLFYDMLKAGSKVIAGKGATYYAIAASAVELVKAILSDAGRILPLSTHLNGEYGANDMCMGVPCRVNAGGLQAILEFPLPENEKKLLDEKIAALDAVYDALDVRNM